MSISSLLFSFAGRIGRRAYLGLLLCTIFLPSLATITLAALIGLPIPRTFVEFQATSQALGAPLFALNLIFLWIGLAAATKRLHDLGRSGWVQVISVLAVIIAFGLLGLAAALQNTPGIVGGGLIALIASLYSFWIGIQMLFFPGDAQANDYGPPRGKARKPQLRVPVVSRVALPMISTPVGASAQVVFGRRRRG